MERRDILAIVAALAVVLILALVVKPMLTHQAPNLGLPETPAPSVPVEQGPAESGVVVTGPTEIVLTPEPTAVQASATPTEIEPQKTGSEIGKPLTSLTPVTWQPDADNPMPAVQMITYADIVGKYTGSTAPFRIPTPYWEIAYNITPSGSMPVFMMDVIQKGVSGEPDKTIRSMVYRQGKEPDPKEGRFFEGGHEYSLNITADQLEKYRITISIPLKYLPDA